MSEAPGHLPAVAVPPDALSDCPLCWELARSSPLAYPEGEAWRLPEEAAGLAARLWGRRSDCPYCGRALQKGPALPLEAPHPLEPLSRLAPGGGPRARLVVLASGSGTNLQAILDACAEDRLPARVVAVVSDRPAAYALERARLRGIPAHPFPYRPFKERGRRAYDEALADLVARYRPDLVLLLGWMRILTMAFLGRFPDRVLNLHPALPGAFPGTRAIERAYRAWREGKVDRTGVMVHWVPDEEVDAGPVVWSLEVPLFPGDRLEDLEARVHAVEHWGVVHAVRRVLGGRG